MIIERLNNDLKAAMLSGDKLRVDTLKGIKTAIQYAAVESRSKGQELDEAAMTAILQKEAKKRQEAAEMYQSANEQERADKERSEKVIIDEYLPAQLDDEAIKALITEAAAGVGGLSQQTMGQVIGAVKAKTGGSADGAAIARLVKEQIG